MSSNVFKDGSPPELLFQSVNGSVLKLIDKSAKAKNVMKFVLYKDTHLNINVTLVLLFATLFLWKTLGISVPFVVSVFVLILQFARFITSVNKDTLTVVEFIGIYTKGNKIFSGLSTCEFVPWDTVVDVFINEVITGQKN